MCCVCVCGARRAGVCGAARGCVVRCVRVLVGVSVWACACIFVCFQGEGGCVRVFVVCSF